MAAQRAGIRKVFIPFDNQDDLEDVADEVKEKLEIIPVKKVTDVLERVLEGDSEGDSEEALGEAPGKTPKEVSERG